MQYGSMVCKLIGMCTVHCVEVNHVHTLIIRGNCNSTITTCREYISRSLWNTIYTMLTACGTGWQTINKLTVTIQ